jgi:hypothetical protein
VTVPDRVPLLALADDHASVRPVADGDPLGRNVIAYDAER